MFRKPNKYYITLLDKNNNNIITNVKAAPFGIYIYIYGGNKHFYLFLQFKTQIRKKI